VTKSSKEWMRRHVKDHYVRKARQEGYRSRAAYKLLEIDAKEKLFRSGQSVLDLGAAPGGWSQVAAQKVNPGGKVIAIDLLQVAPIAGVETRTGDFREQLGELAPVDIVLSDLSPNLSGIRNVDQARSLELLLAAIGACRKLLKPGGVFVSKAFHGEAFEDARAELQKAFSTVKVIKPAASRGESRETYFLARGPRIDE
jgi:23S rRNA (uridine2552-2'-O)-methyltransferase